MSDEKQYTLQKWYEQGMDFCKTCKQQRMEAEEEYHNTLSDMDLCGTLLQDDKYSECLMALGEARRKSREAVKAQTEKRIEMENELVQMLEKIRIEGENK